MAPWGYMGLGGRSGIRQEEAEVTEKLLSAGFFWASANGQGLATRVRNRWPPIAGLRFVTPLGKSGRNNGSSCALTPS